MINRIFGAPKTSIQTVAKYLFFCVIVTLNRAVSNYCEIFLLPSKISDHMNTRLTLVILGATIIMSMIGTLNLPMGHTALATIAPEDDNPNNDWGEVTRQDAQDVDEDSGETHPGLGEHASNPPDIDDHPDREGIGRIGQAVCDSEERVSPSELARILTGTGDCPE